MIESQVVNRHKMIKTFFLWLSMGKKWIAKAKHNKSQVLVLSMQDKSSDSQGMHNVKKYLNWSGDEICLTEN